MPAQARPLQGLVSGCQLRSAPLLSTRDSLNSNSRVAARQERAAHLAISLTNGVFSCHLPSSDAPVTTVRDDKTRTASRANRLDAIIGAWDSELCAQLVEVTAVATGPIDNRYN